MCVKNMVVVNEEDPAVLKNFKVSGHNYDTKGDIEGMELYAQKTMPANLKTLTECMTICNDSTLVINKDTN